MNRKLLLAILPVFACTLLGAAWMLFGPGLGGGKGPGITDAASTKLPDTTPLDLDPEGDTPAGPAVENGARPLDMTAEQAAQESERARREADRLEAERKEAERKESERAGAAAGQPGANPAGQPGTQPATADPAQAERERRINEWRKITRPPNQTLGNARPRARTLKTSAGKKELSEVSPKLLQDRRGLYAKYYAFNQNPLEALLDPAQPDSIDKRTPALTRIDLQVNYPGKDAWADLPFDLGNFMAVWEGFLVVPEDGDYWLYTGADLFSNVRISGEMVLINDMQDYTEVSTVLTLTKGLHPIRIEYLEARNGSVVQDLGACKFMYVPAGMSEPVPVPPEMLLLPEHLWTNDAPIITKLSTAKGEIGDEITIHGQSFGTSALEKQAGLEAKLRVMFAGQEATIVEASESTARVTVPIGAMTGKLMVFRSVLSPAAGEGAVDAGAPPVVMPEVPSNSVDFTVTTQFGLYAGWHNLAGWSNYDFLEPTAHEADLVRLEREFMFESREKLTIPFRNNPLACRWDGKLGIPADWASDGKQHLVRFVAGGRMRITLGTETRATGAEPGAGPHQTTLDFVIAAGTERYLPLSIEWTNESGAASLRVSEWATDAAVGEGVGAPWTEVRVLPTQLFFPPVVPPNPPKIVSVKALLPEGETPAPLPYTLTTTRPSVREGQQFEFVMEVYGNAEVLAQPITLSVDGVPCPYTVTATAEVDATTQRRTCQATLPTGLGEGSMIARMAVVTSDPFLIDVTNKGLIAYYYDLPNPGGYTQMPDPEPMTCFIVRKDAHVNFENANDFKLPFPAETFAVEWYGALIVEREADYTFTCRSDDGVRIWLDDTMLLEDDNLHYQREKSSAVTRLTPGVYTFRMQFFENNVHEVCVLYWQAKEGEGANATEVIAKQVIPKRNYTWDVHPTLPSKTSTYKKSDGTD